MTFDCNGVFYHMSIPSVYTHINCKNLTNSTKVKGNKTFPFFKKSHKNLAAQFFNRPVLTTSGVVTGMVITG